MARILLVSQQLIDRMVDDPAFKEFPCVANPPRLTAPVKSQPPKRCGGCGSRRRRTKIRKRAQGALNYAAIKQAIMAMPEEQQAALKERLGCTGLKIQWRDKSKAVQRRVV